MPSPALTAALALAIAGTPRPSVHKIAVFLVPMDQGAESSVPLFSAHIEEALEDFKTLIPKTNGDLFGLPPDTEAQAALKRAETGFYEGRDAFDHREMKSAEQKFRATLEEYGRAAPAMTECGRMCETLALYAAALLESKQKEDARLALLDLLALAPTYVIDAKRTGDEVVTMRARVAASRHAQMRGNLEVKSNPPGAKVFVDNVERGFTPLFVETLPVGKHLVRIERPGFKRFGRVVDVGSEETSVVADLQMTSSFKSYSSMLTKVLPELQKGKGGATMASLARTYGVDWAISGTLKRINEAGGHELLVGLFDLRTGQLLSQKQANFQGNEFGQVGPEIRRVVNGLLNSSDDPKQSRSSDPLDDHQGTEDWSGEDRGGSQKAKFDRRKGSKDPLEARSGTEDW